MRLLVLEGADKCGKSTLARELSKRLYMPVMNHLKPEENIFIETMHFLEMTEKMPMIIDRLHLSEQAYGKTKRGGSRFDFRQYKIIELAMLAIGAQGVYCYDTEENIKARMIKDNEEYLQQEDVEPLLAHFMSEIENSLLDWKNYKIGDNYDQLLSSIKKDRPQNLIDTSHFFYEYKTIGNLRNATTLIVGDKYGDKLLEPLVPFGNNLPGLKLFEAIGLSALDWNEVAITNAFKHGKTNDESEDIMIKEINLPKIKNILCLGNNAFDFVDDMFLNHNKWNITKIPHPSSAFVYNNLKVEDYAKLINDNI